MADVAYPSQFLNYPVTTPDEEGEIGWPANWFAAGDPSVPGPLPPGEPVF